MLIANESYAAGKAGFGSFLYFSDAGTGHIAIARSLHPSCYCPWDADLVVVAVLILRRQSKPDSKIKQSNLGLDPWKESARRLKDSEDHSP